MCTSHRSVCATGLMLALTIGGAPARGQGSGQGALRSHITVITADGRSKEIIHSSSRLFEAPNWSPDGTYLLLNSGGMLWRLPSGGGEPRVIATGSVTGINNDHGIAPDGKTLAISAGPIYLLPAGGGEPRRITEEVPSYTRRGWDWHELSTNVRGPKLLTENDLGTASRGPLMRPITFTADDRHALAHDRYHHPDPRVQRKMEVLWLKSHGLNHDQIAAYADVSRRTVQRYLDQYLEGGLPRLRRCQCHRPQSALAERESSLEEFFLQHPVRSAKQARAIIEQQTGIRRGLSQVRHFLKDRLGLRWRKTGAIPVPPKKTVEEHAREQAVFLQEKLEPRLEEARRGRRQVYFVDAAHFVFAPFLGFLWCATRLFVRAASGRKRYNVLGALDAVTHRLIRVTNQGYINAESVCALLRAVAEASVGLPITLVLDNARYQKCALVQTLAASLGIELLYLPGYSPNLNLIERLWRFVRKQSLDSIYYEDFARFTAAIDQCLGDLPTVHKGEMETLLTHEFQMFEDVPLLAA